MIIIIIIIGKFIHIKEINEACVYVCMSNLKHPNCVKKKQKFFFQNRNYRIITDF